MNKLNGESTNTSFSDDTNEKLDAAVASLIENKANSLVVAGSNDPNVQMIVNKINYELENYGYTIDTKNTLNLFHTLISQKKSRLGLLTGIQVLSMMEMILLIY